MAATSSPSERVAVTMPAELVAGIDRWESNRSRFIAEAVRHELKRRRRAELLRSLEEPHPESVATAALGLENWEQGLPAGDGDLRHPRGGVPLHWCEVHGWQQPDACIWHEANASAGATDRSQRPSWRPSTTASASIWASPQTPDSAEALTAASGHHTAAASPAFCCSSTSARPSRSASVILVCIGQCLGPHIEQNSACL